ncbi:MAG: EF-P lysine aminoacylase GenX [Deltaproteobacteria bacterium]|nr:EF-P lysine aminoacylase GenX [Deltaproteobacteria bacterium]
MSVKHNDQIANLAKRARIVAALRRFLDDRGYLEVETPCIVQAPGQDPHLRCFQVLDARGNPVGYLRTSPEHAAKRLLSRGFPRLYELSKVFRDEPRSMFHQPEFTLLEFYGTGLGTNELKEEMTALIRAAAGITARDMKIQVDDISLDFSARPLTISIGEILEEELGIDWRSHSTAEDLMEAAKPRGIDFDGIQWTFDQVFSKLMLEVVEPSLPLDRMVFLDGFPASQASYAKLLATDPGIADRFELYIGGIELANAFSELNDPVEQRRRFEKWIEERRNEGGPDYPIDEDFLDELSNMPNAAGAALGIDRLVMLLTGKRDLVEVISFPAGSNG